MKKVILCGLASGLITLLPPAAAWAAAGPAGSQASGLTVSPAIEQLNLAKDQTDASFTSQVTNNTKVPVLVNISTNDFTALNETGGITFFNSNLPNNSHGLANWINPGYTQLALAPGASQSVPIDIPNVDSLAPGGHYGAIIYKVVSSGSVPLGNQVNANEEISVLVFLTTYSGGTQAIRLDNALFGSLTDKLPKTLNAVFTNSGNTQTVPRGLITITGPRGNEVARGIINIDSGLILPGTSRLYTIALTSEGKLVYPGVYHIRAVYQTGGAATATVYSKSFLLVNQALLVIIGVVVVAAGVVAIRRFGPAPPKRRHKP